MTATDSPFLKKLLLLFLVFAGLHFAEDFLIPLAIGAVLATLFLPFSKWMERMRFPRWLAVSVCLLILLLAIAGIGALFGWQISELTSDVALIKQIAADNFSRIQAYLFDHLGIPAERQSEILKEQQPTFFGFIPRMLSSLTFILADFILILAYVFLLLYYRGHIRQFLLKLFPPDKQKEMELVLTNAAHVSQQYLVGLTKMILCLWVMYYIGFSIVGVKNALFFAILCGLLEIVPYVGNMSGTAMTVLVAGVHGASLPMMGGIVLTYGIIQFIQGWFLEPIIVGPQVKINPFATIIALVLGELVWGIPGIILAIPLIAIFKIICDHIESLQPYGFLIGEIDNGKSGTGWLKRIREWYKTMRHS